MTDLAESGFFGPSRIQAFANVELLRQMLADSPHADIAAGRPPASAPTHASATEDKTCPVCNGLQYGQNWYDDSTIRGPVHYLNTTLVAVDKSAPSCCWCSILRAAIAYTLPIKPHHFTSAPIYIRLETDVNTPYGLAPLKVVVVTSEDQRPLSMTRMEIELYRLPVIGRQAAFD